MLNKVYNNIFEALTGKGYVGVVDGYPGSGKSQILVQIILNLMQSKEILKRKRDLKILVTAPSDTVVDALALKLKDLRSSNNVDASKYSTITSL